MTSEEVTILFREWRRLDPPQSKTLQEILRGGASNLPVDPDAPNLGWRVGSSIGKRDPGQSVRISSVLKRHGYRWVDAAIFWKRGGEGAARWVPDVADVSAAYDLHADTETTALLRAALFATDSTPETVAHVMSLPVAVVQAFDALFFNVLDRKEDVIYRRKIVEEDSGYGRDMIRKITGESGCPDLLQIAFEGSLNEVMVAARRSSVEQTEANLVRNTRLVALRAAAECDRGKKAPLVTLGLAIAREWQDDGAAQVETGTLEDPFLRELLEDSTAYNDRLRAKHRGEDPET
jgi:hypothetical protein